MTPTLILINPWIYDFAAYDLWSKPLGLLYLASYLRRCGFKIHFIDCLDVYHPKMKAAPSIKMPTRRSYGTGKYWREEIRKPSALSDIPRTYCRYGLSLEIFEEELNKTPTPAAILVTSLMTYWYPGVREAISLAKKNHPGVPVVLGGIYATLCYNHALENLEADRVLKGNDPKALLEVLSDFGITAPGPVHDSVTISYPAFDLLTQTDYICLLTSTGCPYRCRYCASYFLNPHPNRREPDEVLDEILYWHKKFGIRDFSFYDDALLIDSENHLMVLLERLERLELNLRFHTPNALHVKEITPDIAEFMHRTGFRTIRLGLETSDLTLHHDLDNKIIEGDFERAAHLLLKACFNGAQVGAYILIGLPGQSVSSVLDTINFVAKTGTTPFLSEYSPIPHTSPTLSRSTSS